MRLAIALALLLAGREGVLLPDVSAAVERYATALRDVERRADGASLERTFAEARALRDVLLRQAGAVSEIERLSDDQFNALVSAAKALIVNREEVLIVEPDAAAFLRLAMKRGSATDQAFFKAYADTYGSSAWPSYVEQQTDVSGCTAFGGGELTGAYAAWTSFRNAHPKAYVPEVERELESIESRLVESTCACGDEADVLRELEQFAKRFPGAPIRKRVIERIESMKRGRSGIRFQCLSG